MTRPSTMRTLIVGTDEMAASVAAIVNDIERDAATVPVPRVPGGGFDLGVLAAYPPSQWTFLAAVGSEFLNLLRLGLFAQLRLQGYKATRAISRKASLPQAFRQEENVVVGPNAVIGEGTTIAYNAHIGAGAVLGRNCVVDHSAWIAPGVILGDGVRIGECTILASGVVVGDGVGVGSHCELAIARQHFADVPDRSFESRLFDDVVRILPAGRDRAAKSRSTQARVAGGHPK